MNKIIIEVGSTNTKIDIYDGEKIKRLEEITIPFKKNYKKNKTINQKDIEKLTNKILELQKDYEEIYVCGTSIFRELNQNKKEAFLNNFFELTGLEFHIISQTQENELTVLGATRFVNKKVGVFIGGGGSTEISIFDKEIIESKNTSLGGIDIMNAFPDLDEEYAKTSLKEVMDYIEERLNIPNTKADILILAGGGHEFFARNSGIRFEKNILYKDNSASIMMDIETRIKETKRFYENISLTEIKKRVTNPDWWFATRAMCAFVLVVAKKLEAKYIVPTNISMVYGIIEKKK
ncbi:MAG: hypothetical protein HFJ02_05380 [Bacilli bacterium]|nr:hypothetical protein [Bacilli bacterium]